MSVTLIIQCVKDIIVTLVLLVAVNILINKGFQELIKTLCQFLLQLPALKSLVGWYLKKEVHGFLKQVGLGGEGQSLVKPLPEKGLTSDQLITELKRRKSVEFDPHTGKGFAYVYTLNDVRFKTIQKAFDMFSTSTDESVEDTKLSVVNMFFHSFMHENALNPLVFPSLRQFEVELVAMTAWMLHGEDGVVGNVTSGGTESILMAMKTYRDRARDLFPQITHPEVVAPITIHPAFEKAAQYFDISIIHVPITDYKLDMKAYEKAITINTILLLGSAPEYCHGIIDPIMEISCIAEKRKLPFHVDACFGGFMLPWVEKCGYSIPQFDFRLKGVTSMSADIHKYGLGPKGASVVLYRSSDIRRYQLFSYVDWPGGLFGSPSMAGTRPGGNLAASWAAMMLLGQDGYMDVARLLMNVTQHMIQGIRDIPELIVCGSPNMTAFAFTSEYINIFAVADQMEEKDWKIERGSQSIHCTVLPSHTIEVANDFIADLKTAVTIVQKNPILGKKGSAGVYGMAGKIPERGLVKDFVTEFFNEVFTLH